MYKKDKLSMFLWLCSNVETLSSNIMIYPENQLEPSTDFELKFHRQVGWEFKIFLEPCLDTMYLDCKYPCVIIYHPLVKHPISKFSDSYCVCIGNFIDDFSVIYNNEITLFPEQKLHEQCIESNFKCLEKIQELYAIIKEKHSASKPYLIQSYLLAFFSFIIGMLEQHKEETETSEALINKATIYIKKTYHERDLSVASVAKHVGITRNYLANLFNKYKMPTIRKYIIDVRLYEARKLLETLNFSIKEVAFLTGWEDQFYFSNSFLKKYKIRPSSLLGKKVQ